MLEPNQSRVARAMPIQVILHGGILGACFVASLFGIGLGGMGLGGMGLVIVGQCRGVI